MKGRIEPVTFFKRDLNEIFKLLDSLGRKPSEVALDHLMAKMDPDGSGDVDAWRSNSGVVSGNRD